MCGIFGIGFLKDNSVNNKREIIQLVRNLFKNVESRGRRASGIAITSSKDISVLKGPMSGSQFIETTEFSKLLNSKLRLSETYVDVERTLAIIGHCRLDTKGSPSDNANNHPIVVNNIVGVHNGVIGNDDAIYNVAPEGFPKRIGRVDSEVIFASIEYYRQTIELKMVEAIERTIRDIRGSVACAVVDARSPYNLWLFRQNNPISVMLSEKAGIFVFASQYHMAKESIGNMFGSTEEIVMPVYSSLCINLHYNSYSTHDLPAGGRSVLGVGGYL